MERRREFWVRLLSIGIVLSITGCQPESKSDASAKVERERSSSLQFDESDVPFIFSYSPAFFGGASTSFRLRQGNNGPEAAPPEYQRQIDDHDGIHIRQAAPKEFSSDAILAQAKNAVLAAKGAPPDLRTENCGGREVVVVESDFEFPTQPPLPGHSISYSFGAGGKTWQVEFFSSNPDGRTAASNASLQFCRTVSFR